MSKYIDAEKIPFVTLDPSQKDPLDYVRRSTIDMMPSADVVAVVRCRDCKHWDKTWTNDWAPDYHYCPMIDGTRKGDFYCADAERRTGE